MHPCRLLFDPASSLPLKRRDRDGTGRKSRSEDQLCKSVASSLPPSLKMKNLKSISFLILSVSLLSGCNFINNAFTYKDTTEEFVNALITEDYDKGLSLMSGNEAPGKAAVDSLKLGLVQFREVIVGNFGEDLDYKFMSAHKTFSTEEGESTAPNTTRAQVEFTNEKDFGVFELVFDDSNNKILHIRVLDVKEEIPGMLLFWLFGILAVSVPIFNIWVMRKIKKSSLKKKWVKYLAVLFFNVPAITYNALSGLSINFLSFQILFGISFEYMGYLNSFWTFGIPFGGCYWFWKLKRQKALIEELEEQQPVLD